VKESTTMMPTNHTHPRCEVPPYSRADAITDGLLITIPDLLTRAFGFQVPLAVTRGAWADAVAWPDRAENAKPRRARLTETERVTALLCAARAALTAPTDDGRDIEFQLHRVPVAGPETRALRRTMVLHLHGGDFGEPVATIGTQHIDPVGHFQPIDEGHRWWPAVGFDHTDGRPGPVVTADTLDDLLSALTTLYPDDDVTPGFLPGEIDVHHADIVQSLLPAEHGHYHLGVLGWDWRCRQLPPTDRP
jgi:hypothetical protein